MSKRKANSVLMQKVKLSVPQLFLFGTLLVVVGIFVIRALAGSSFVGEEVLPGTDTGAFTGYTIIMNDPYSEIRVGACNDSSKYIKMKIIATKAGKLKTGFMKEDYFPYSWYTFSIRANRTEYKVRTIPDSGAKLFGLEWYSTTYKEPHPFANWSAIAGIIKCR